MELSQKENQDAEQNQGNLEVEHSYINYQYMIMGEKIKHLKDNLPGNFKLDQYTLSKMLNDNNLEFYKMETIQDIIRIQWTTAKKFTMI